jgi:WD40 repeat protein
MVNGFTPAHKTIASRPGKLQTWARLFRFQFCSDKLMTILGTLENTVLNAKFSAIAHEKEINNLSVSPNDKIVASASQDKTVKVRIFMHGRVIT